MDMFSILRRFAGGLSGTEFGGYWDIRGWPRLEKADFFSGQILNCQESASDIQLSSPIRKYLPHLLVGVSISLIMVGAYAAVGSASSTTPKSLWSTSPLTITFSGSGGTSSSGSAGDSFKCAPSVTGVTLKASVSSPTKISLTVSQTVFASCGPPFNSVTLTTNCLVDASNCKGTYTGTVTIFQPSEYRTISPDLSVTIVVT